MSFYGNIANGGKTQFVFDKVYPNKKTMDENASKDGVFIGRYAFVEYEDNGFPYRLAYRKRKPSITDQVRLDTLDQKVKDKNHEGYVLFFDSDYKQPYSVTDENAGEGYGIKVGDIFYTTFSEDDEAIKAQNEIIAAFYKYQYDATEENFESLRLKYTQQNSPFSLSWEEFIALGGEDKIAYISQTFQHKTYYYYYECTSGLIDIEYTDVNGDPYVITASIFNWIFTSTDEKDSNGVNDYSLNYYLDKQYAKNKNITFLNGWDSTVWQKVFRDGKEEYMYVASLNSDLPQFTLKPEAPTTPPIAPHLGVTSTNNNYTVHMQQPWGIRIKKTEEKYEDGTPLSDVGIAEDSGVYTYYDEEKQKKVALEDYPYPGDIYFNGKGFDIKNRHRDEEHENKVTLTEGASGEQYIVHDPDGDYGVSYEPANDLKELSVHLPAIGNAISDLYDLLYGDYDKNGQIKDKRNLIVGWDVDNKIEGARLVSEDFNTGGFTYDPERIGSVAGTINTVHDLMGMIVYEGNTPLNQADPNKIYYRTKDEKGNSIRPGYFMKKPTCEFESIGDYDAFSKKRWYFDLEQYEAGKYYTQIATSIEGKHNYFCEKSPEPLEGVKYFTWSKEPELILLKNWNGGQEEEGDVPVPPPGEEPVQPSVRSYYYEGIGLAGEIFAEGCSNLQINEEQFLKTLEKYTSPIDYKKYFFTYENNTWNFLGTTPCDLATFGITYDGEVITPELPEDEKEEIVIPESRIDIFYGHGYYQDNSETADATKDYYFVTATPATNSASTEEGSLFTKFYKPNDYTEIVQVEQPDGTTRGEEKHKVVNIIGDRKYYTGYFYYDPSDDTFRPALSGIPYDENKIYYFIENYYVEENQFDAETGKLVDIYYKDFEVLNVVSVEKYKVTLLEFEPNLYYREIHHDEVVDYVLVNSLNEIDSDLEYCTIETQLVTGYLEKPSEDEENEEEGEEGEEENPTPDEPKEIIYTHFYTPNAYHYKRGDDYILSRDEEMVEGRSYYFLSPILADVKFYKPGNYLYVPLTKDENGDWVASKEEVLDLSDKMKVYPEPQNADYKLDPEEIETWYDENHNPINYLVYFIKKKTYVISDKEGILDYGSEWESTIRPPKGVEIGTLIEDTYEWRELTGFARTLNTINGLILKINQVFLFNDEVTRDDTTIQGNLNRIKDFFNKFDALTPGDLTFVDNYGRITTAKTETDAWIQLETNPVVKQTKISITHENPNASVDMYGQQSAQTLTFGGTFNSINFGVDAKGHVNKSKIGNAVITMPPLTVNAAANETNVTGDIITKVSSNGQSIDVNKTAVGNLLLTGFTTEKDKVTTIKSISDSDSLNGALSQFEFHLNNLDSSINLLNRDAKPVVSIANTATSIAVAKVAEVVASAPEKYDTLKEIADYIESDTTGAANVATNITNIQTDITNLKTADTQHGEAIEGLETKLDGVDETVIKTIQNLIATTKFTYKNEEKTLQEIFTDLSQAVDNGNPPTTTE